MTFLDSQVRKTKLAPFPTPCFYLHLAAMTVNKLLDDKRPKPVP